MIFHFLKKSAQLRRCAETRMRRFTAVTLLSCASCAINALANTNQDIAAEELYQTLPTDFTPSLAERGKHSVGVRTIELTNPQQLDINSGQMRDRSLTVELWYPSNDHQQSSRYDNVTRLGKPFAVRANALRDAPVKSVVDNQRYPLVVLSHGYTGYRTLMFYLGEHLASHGYVVAGIDHTDSINADVSADNPYTGFPSTLYNRSRDQNFVRQQLLADSSPVAKQVDQQSSGLIGYSMGGYGLVGSIGGCYHFSDHTLATLNPAASQQERQQAQQLLNNCDAPRSQNGWQAAIAMAPWGQQLKVFDAKSLATINTPLMTIVGDLDDVSDYASVAQLHQAVGSQDKYQLTYLNARHNVAAHPAPRIAYEHAYDLGHYFEAAWDSRQINQINQHLVLAMMNCHLKQSEDACELLDLEGRIENGWRGFPKRFATGLQWIGSPNRAAR